MSSLVQFYCATAICTAIVITSFAHPDKVAEDRFGAMKNTVITSMLWPALLVRGTDK